jgi:hypothetical protein
MADYSKRRIVEILIPGIILAFALSVLVYVGSALLQTVHLTSLPQPTAALGSATLGFVLGILGSLAAQHNKRRG